MRSAGCANRVSLPEPAGRQSWTTIGLYRRYNRSCATAETTSRPSWSTFRGDLNERGGLGLAIEGVDRDAMATLEGDDWPGNVRELEAVVKRAMVRRRVTNGAVARPISRTQELWQRLLGRLAAAPANPFEGRQSSTREGKP